jgi:GH25 family lysozyme M1 (1,4-beta-N-acetylmuramidase)
MMTRTLAIATAALTTLLAATSVAQAQRAIGIDVSYWQGESINWSQVRNQGKIDFAFIRASRGGTTGYSDSSGFGYGSRRYDDPYLDLNMSGARQAGIFAGAYHFARPDVMIGWSDSRGVAYDNTNTGLDEANHFIEEAGAYMRAGYIRPVLDLEVGASRGRTGLTDFALEFSDRIYEATGVRPIIYANSNYASGYFDSRCTTVTRLRTRRQRCRSITRPPTRSAFSRRPPSRNRGISGNTRRRGVRPASATAR